MASAWRLGSTPPRRAASTTSRALRADQDAARAGLTLRWSNGQTEGQVTKPKLVTRQDYERARVDLLRKRLLRAA